MIGDACLRTTKSSGGEDVIGVSYLLRHGKANRRAPMPGQPCVPWRSYLGGGGTGEGEPFLAAGLAVSGTRTSCSSMGNWNSRPIRPLTDQATRAGPLVWPRTNRTSLPRSRSVTHSTSAPSRDRSRSRASNVPKGVSIRAASRTRERRAPRLPATSEFHEIYRPIRFPSAMACRYRPRGQ